MRSSSPLPTITNCGGTLQPGPGRYWNRALPQWTADWAPHRVTRAACLAAFNAISFQTFIPSELRCCFPAPKNGSRLYRLRRQSSAPCAFVIARHPSTYQQRSFVTGLAHQTLDSESIRRPEIDGTKPRVPILGESPSAWHGEKPAREAWRWNGMSRLRLFVAALLLLSGGPSSRSSAA